MEDEDALRRLIAGIRGVAPEALEPVKPAVSESVWNVPHRRNQYFTDRLVLVTLIDRDPEAETISIHRMVQEAVRESLDDSLECSVAVRVIGALVRSHPGYEIEKWPLCERLEPHWLAIVAVIDQLVLASEATGLLLNQVGYYIDDRGRYREAAPLYERSLQIREQMLGAEHPDVAQSLNNLAMLHKAQGEYAKAAPLYERSLQIREKVLGAEHPTVVTVVENYLSVLRELGRNQEADELEARSGAMPKANQTTDS